MQMEGQKSALLKAQEALTGQSSSTIGLQNPASGVSTFRLSEIGHISLVSHPAITEEDCGTSGQTAKLAYKYERYESCFAIAGADYCVIAADYTRDHTKISQLNEKVVMASCGFQAAVKALLKVLSAESWIYKREHNKPMSCPEMARLFDCFQKYHHDGFNVLGGLDSKGKGYVYTPVNIDAVASGVGHSSQDPASTFIVPPIFKYKLPAKVIVAQLSETEAVDFAKSMFASVTHTGDKLEIVVLNASGLRREYMDLRKDCDSGGQCSRETNIENHNPLIKTLSIAELYQKQNVGQISALMKAQEALTGQSSSTIGSSSFGQKPAFGGAPTKVVGIETLCRIGKGSKDRESEDRNTNRSSGFGQKPAFGGAPTFGATSTPAFVSTSTPVFFGSTLSAFAVNAPFGHWGALFGPMFGSTRLQNPAFGNTGFGQSEVGEISLISLPAITEDGGTSGQTAKLAYKYERFESCFAIAGPDYCVIAADYTRYHTKITQLTEKSVMASCGFQTAALKFRQQISSAQSWKYHHDGFNVLGGLDSEGKGYVFTRVNGAVASGLGHSSQDPASTFIVPPILKYELPAKDVLARLSETEAVDLAKTMFASVTHTGDKLEIVVLNASGLHREYMDLRKDCDRCYGQVYSRKKQRK